MPRDPKTYERLKAMLASGELSDEVRAQVEDALAEFDAPLMAEHASNISIPDAGAYTPPSAAQATELASKPSVQQVVARLDPKLPLTPQLLANQPATTHPKGDQAAAAEWATGRLDNPKGVDVFYEAPAAKVREDLMQNPGLFRTLGYDAPMTAEGIMAIEPGDPIIQSYNDYHWRGAADNSAKTGRTAYRYSKAPWMQGSEHGPIWDTATTKALNALAPGAEGLRALVLGYDSTANWNAGTRGAERASNVEQQINEQYQAEHPGFAEKAAAEKAEREKARGSGLAIHQDKPAAEVNDAIREEHPILEGVGEVAGMAPGLIRKGVAKAASAVGSAGTKLAQGVAGPVRQTLAERGIRGLEQWNLSNGLWEWGASGGGPGWTKLGGVAGKVAGSVPGKVALDVAHGAASGAADQLAREGVTAVSDLVDYGQSSVTPKGAYERAVDAAKSGAMWSAPFSAASRLSGSVGGMGRRHAERRFPEIQEAAPHLEWDMPKSIVSGPGLKAETRKLVEDAAAQGIKPGDITAEELAGPMQQRVNERMEALTARHGGEVAAHEVAPEGVAEGPVTNLLRATLNTQRAHHQPTAGGGQRPVTDKTRVAKRLFNLHVGDASFEPKPGSFELSPSEATHFLAPGMQGKLFRNDVAEAAKRRAGKPIDRAALVQHKIEKLPPRKQEVMRRELEDEIDQAIADELDPQVKFGRTFDERSAEYKAAEQKVLGDIRDADEVLEPFGGSLAEYMKQRGKDKVYITPHTVDAKRLETIIGSLEGGAGQHQAGKELESFRQAALADRKARPGGGHEMRVRQGKELEDERKIYEAVAPGGDAFKAAIKHGVPTRGDSRDVAIMRQIADEAGPDVRKKLDEHRSLEAALDVTSRGFFSGSRDPLRRVSPSVSRLGNAYDATLLRAYPVLRALEPMGGFAAGRMGQIETYGKGAEESEKRREARDQERAPRYRKKTKGQHGAVANRRETYATKLERVKRAREEVRKRRQPQP